MGSCLRCGADSSWIKGRVPVRPRDEEVRDLRSEVASLRAENAALRERLHHPCDGCPGCSSNDCPDALDVAQIDLVVWRHEAERLRTRNVVVEDTLRQLLAGCVEFFGKRDCPAYMAVLIQNGKGTLAAAKPAENGAGGG